MGISEGVINNGEAPDEDFYLNLLNEDHKNLSKKELLAVKFAKAMGKDPKQLSKDEKLWAEVKSCLLYTSPSPRDATLSRMPSSA